MISWLGYCHVSDYHEKAIFVYCPSEPLLQIVQNLIGLKSYRSNQVFSCSTASGCGTRKKKRVSQIISAGGA